MEEHKYRFTGPITISGTGSLNKSGGGTLYLAAANSFSGRTTIPGGTLVLLGSGAIVGATNIILSKTTLDAIGRTDGTLTLVSAQTLTGNGTINGNLVANPGATVAPGTSKIGTLLVTNGLFDATGASSFSDASATNYPNRFYLISIP
jgi:autotransporter-associated beta strand protein